MPSRPVLPGKYYVCEFEPERTEEESRVSEPFDTWEWVQIAKLHMANGDKARLKLPYVRRMKKPR